MGRKSTLSAKKKSDPKSTATKRKRKVSLVPEPETSPVKCARQDENELILQGYDTELKQLNKTLECLLKIGQASSCIICGDSGVGKSTLVKKSFSTFPVIQNACQATQLEDVSFGHLNVVVISFDGNLQGKNDFASIRLIGKKLNAFLEENDQIVLDDIDEDQTEIDETILKNKAIHSVPKIMEKFRYLTEHCPCFRAIVVLDHFEEFCRRQQTLLYNLLDMTQHGKSLLVIGLTRRLDCIDLLEKRVRSRLTQRIIHLVIPFSDLESFRLFCIDQAKRTIFGKHSVWHNIQSAELTDQFDKEISKCFELSRNFDEIQRMILEYSFVCKTKEAMVHKNGETDIKSDSCVETTKISKVDSSVFLHKDPKIVSCFNLTRNELIILIIATRNLRNLQLESFTSKLLYEWCVLVKHLKQVRFPQIIKAVYKLMELDLVIFSIEVRSNLSKTQLSITPWTSLMLNISDFQLVQLLDGLGDKVPSYIRQLLNG